MSSANVRRCPRPPGSPESIAPPPTCGRRWTEAPGLRARPRIRTTGGTTPCRRARPTGRTASPEVGWVTAPTDRRARAHRVRGPARGPAVPRTRVAGTVDPSARRPSAPPTGSAQPRSPTATEPPPTRPGPSSSPPAERPRPPELLLPARPAVAATGAAASTSRHDGGDA